MATGKGEVRLRTRLSACRSARWLKPALRTRSSDSPDSASQLPTVPHAVVSGDGHTGLSASHAGALGGIAHSHEISRFRARFKCASTSAATAGARPDQPALRRGWPSQEPAALRLYVKPTAPPRPGRRCRMASVRTPMRRACHSFPQGLRKH